MKLKLLLLSLLTLLGIITANASDFEVDGIAYNRLNGSTVEVTQDYTYSGNITIPSSVTYNNVTYNVTSIGDNAFQFCHKLTSIEIPNSVTSIGNYAFTCCCSLTSITIPNSVTSIGDFAFGGCSYLISVTIGNSVRSIGKNPFASCTSLTSITVVDGYYSYYESPDGCNAIINKGTHELVTGCKNTTIPNGVTSIGMYAFEGCTGLTSTEIPNSVTSIGEGAFSGCSGLTSVVSGIEEPFAFGNNAFSGISSSCTLTVPVGTRDAYIAAGWTEDIFKGGIVEAVIFADANVKALCVANWDTNDDGELSEAEAKAVTDLGKVFKENTAIISFNELQYFTGLTAIGNYAFSGCSGLTSVTIPNSVKSIGMYVFEGCTGLTFIEIPNSVTSLGVNPFSRCTSLTSISVADGNTIFDSPDGCNAIINTGTHELVTGCKNTTIPNSVTSIGGRAFSDCIGLTSIEIPNSVTSIGGHAFYNCISLTSIEIPNSVTSIGNGAFRSCIGLTSVALGNGVTSINWHAFEDCIGLTSVFSEIEEPFAYPSSSFNNIGSSCTLTVPYGTRDAYIAAGWTENVFKGGIVEAATPPVSITLNSLGKGTYCSEYPLNFTNVSGIEAYIVSGFKPSAGNLIITRAYEVPAGTGLYIVGTPGNTYNVPVEPTDFYYSNMLKGVLVPTVIHANEDNYTNYVLSSDGHGGVIFKHANDTSSPANRAYVQIPSSIVGAREFLGIETDDDSTGLDGVFTPDTKEAEGDYYNLSGQKVQNPQRGIFIKNGKKILIH